MRKTCAALICLWASAAAATDYRADPATYRSFLSRLQPGDRLLLQPGDYREGLPLHGLTGTATHPILIGATQPQDPPRFFARDGANTVSLVDVRHLVLRDLELDGRDMPVDALKAEGHAHYADFVTIEHLHIHDYAASQQNVGISTKCAATGWTLRSNRIERVGTGVYLGNADGSAPFVAGLIENNEIRATRGYSLQIKHQVARAGGAPAGQDTVIRNNVFDKSDAAPGPLARPNVLLGHLPRVGPGSQDRYLVYGNHFLHNPSEALLQAEGRVAIYDNVFLNRGGDAVHIQPHNDVPRDVVIFSNTVLASGVGIRVRQAPDVLFRTRVLGNVVAARTPLDGGDAAYNLTLNYRHDLLDVPPAMLTARLLHAAIHPPRLPLGIREALAEYPDWLPREQTGARLHNHVTAPESAHDP